MAGGARGIAGAAQKVFLWAEHKFSCVVGSMQQDVTLL
jgi:hypothetical protein